MDLKKTLLNFLGFFVLIAGSFAAGYFTYARLHPTPVDFPILSEAYNYVETHGYEEIPEDPAMEYGAIRGMVAAYGDPHTRFEAPPQTELNSDRLAGSYGGIGAQMGRDAEGFIVLHPFEESPATEAGLRDGDRLLAIDGAPVTPETSMDDVVAAVRGPEGERVTLLIARPPDYAEMEFTVRRAEIPLPSVTFHLDATTPTLGVIRVNVIAASTPDEISAAVDDLRARGATHFVMDLRDNGGGLLEEGVEIARLFLTEGIVIEKQFKGQDVETY